MKRNKTIDILKGVSIIMVLITHYTWSNEQRLNPVFPFLIDMAVPIFMIISGYVGALSFREHGIINLSKAYSMDQIIKKYIRYTVPFLIILLWQVIEPNANAAIKGTGLLNYSKWILSGTSGSGSYYYPIIIQLIFIFPIIYFIIIHKKEKGLLLCLVTNMVFEILKWSYNMNDECYRLLIFRYIFVIATGVYAAFYRLKLRESLIMTLGGGIFIWLTTYGYYTPHIITSWTGTCFIAVMWIVPFTNYVICNVKLNILPLEIIGKASYNIFFVQMVFYRVYIRKVETNTWMGQLIASIVICIACGLLFYYFETPITKMLYSKIKNAEKN